MNYIKSFIKLLILFCIGGFIYYFIEIMWRGFSNLSMIFVGGLCFIACGLINEFYSWEMPLWKQSIIATLIITVIEYISGLILNIWLKLGIWDYSSLPFNLHGQICLYYSFAWLGLATIAIILDDWLRYWIFEEDRPIYRLI